jgi:hypothetical protein
VGPFWRDSLAALPREYLRKNEGKGRRKATRSVFAAYVKSRKSKMGMLELTPDMRIATSMEDISRYIGEIKQLLHDLSRRPEIDNNQLKRIAIAVSEIQRVIPALLLR